ncbi:hypothetical protein MNBD_PLANCTO02-2108 [hydrothermal vent metagenome]|uniref:Uncharacterized protein n=1 Tax=hydrothermal vent metagenome TaxID=652676 RepID=A0A3B1E096_9ZZZZ
MFSLTNMIETLGLSEVLRNERGLNLLMDDSAAYKDFIQRFKLLISKYPDLIYNDLE